MCGPARPVRYLIQIASVHNGDKDIRKLVLRSTIGPAFGKSCLPFPIIIHNTHTPYVLNNIIYGFLAGVVISSVVRDVPVAAETVPDLFALSSGSTMSIV